MPETLKTTADRLRFARVAARLTQQQIADYCGIDRAAVSQWEAREEQKRTRPSADNYAKIERLTGFPVGWLVEGGPTPSRAFKSQTVMTTAGSSGKMIKEEKPAYLQRPDTAAARRIPLLTTHQAGTTGMETDYTPEEEETVGIDAELAERIGPRAFAVTLPDNAMTPQFKQGDIVIIDPDATADPGDFVLARLDGAPAAVFRKYRDRGRDDQGCAVFELVPLNDDYPIVVADRTNPGEIVGPAIEYRRRLK